MGGAPKPPDPYDTAGAQFQQNMGSAAVSSIMNNPNISGPSGNTQYTLSGYEEVTGPNGETIKVPRYNQTTTLSNAGQNQLDQRNSLINRLFGQVQNTPQVSTAGLPAYQTSYNTPQLKSGFQAGQPSVGFMDLAKGAQLGTDTGTSAYRTNFGSDLISRFDNTEAYKMDPRFSSGNLALGQNTQAFNPSYRGNDLTTSYAPEEGFSADRRRVEEAMMSRAGELLGESRQGEVARMAAMGLAPGSAHYGRVSDQFERSANDLAMQSVLAGGQEQSRQLGEARASAGFTNEAMGQAYGMDMGLTAAENARRAGEASFRNQAIGQGFTQDFGMQQAENARRAASAAFGNQAVGQGFAQDMALQQNENTRRQSDAAFRNQAIQSQTQMQAALREMENAKRAGDTARYNASLEAYNNAQIAQTQMEAGEAAFTNNARGQMFDERTSHINNIINQLMGVMGGAQVNSPSAPGFQGQGIAAPDLAGLISSNYGQQVGAYNNKMTGLSNMFGAAMKLFA